MRELPLSRAYTLIEPGPVVLVTTCDGSRNNVMTIAWTMVLDFKPLFAIATGDWNYSCAALLRTLDCVLAIPAVDLLDQSIGVGTCSGANTDKFSMYSLTPLPAKLVKAPLIKECLANIECKVIDHIPKHNIVVLEGIMAYVDPDREETRSFHAVGDGTFIVDGAKIERRSAMKNKLPSGS